MTIEKNKCEKIEGSKVVKFFYELGTLATKK